MSRIHHAGQPEKIQVVEMIFAYIGPETMMPVASVIAAGAGFFMMFGRGAMAAGRRMVRRVWPRSKPK